MSGQQRGEQRTCTHDHRSRLADDRQRQADDVVLKAVVEMDHYFKTDAFKR